MGRNISVFNGFVVVKIIDLGVKRRNTIIYDIFLRMLYKTTYISRNSWIIRIRQFIFVPYMFTPFIQFKYNSVT